MRTKLTGSLAVCVAAAVFTAGALLLNDDSPAPAPVAAAATGTEAGAAAASRAGGYGTAARGPSAPPPPAPRPRPRWRSRASPSAPSPPVEADGSPIQSRDGVPHTVTADNGSFDSGRIGPNGTATIVAPAAPGSYRFTCLIHPQMVGTLVVR